MATYADATCGFLPLHLYEGPSLERALDICQAINSFAMESMGFGPVSAKARTLLDPLGLRDMLDAVDEVTRFNGRPEMLGVSYSSYMHPAERLIAAVYTLLNFPTRTTDKEDDEIPVRFTTRGRWTGDDVVHFLLVGQRLRSELDDEETDEEEQDGTVMMTVKRVEPA